jgi:hypothetical protein
MSDGIANRGWLDRRITPVKTNGKRFSHSSSLPALPARMRAAIELLARAWRYAQEQQADIWAFAVEMDDVRAASLSLTDLRWLTASAYIEHAPETTRAGLDRRTFRKDGQLSFTDKSVFVLTDAGAAAFRGPHRRNAAEPLQPGSARREGRKVRKRPLPYWDKRNRRLWLGDVLIKEFAQPAPDQEAILSVFQEQRWKCPIDDPLTGRDGRDAKQHLRQTVDNLNRHMNNPLIRFGGDGTGQGIRWYYRD